MLLSSSIELKSTRIMHQQQLQDVSRQRTIVNECRNR